MHLKVGDKVRFLNERGEGFVSKIIDSQNVFVHTDGFDFAYRINQLVKVPASENEEVSHVPDEARQKEILNRVILEKEEPRGSPIIAPKRSPGYNKQGIKEIDLHIHELLDTHHKMSNGEMLQMQLEYCRQSLEEAIRNKEKGLILIHGVGEGVLKTEVRTLLKLYPNVEFHDASYRRYGYGATEVIIH